MQILVHAVAWLHYNMMHKTEIKNKKERKIGIKKAKCKKQRKNKQQGPKTQTDRQLRTENQMHNYEQKRYNKWNKI